MERKNGRQRMRNSKDYMGKNGKRKWPGWTTWSGFLPSTSLA